MPGPGPVCPLTDTPTAPWGCQYPIRICSFTSPQMNHRLVQPRVSRELSGSMAIPTSGQGQATPFCILRADERKKRALTIHSLARPRPRA